jgi:NAD(P)H-dependent flavin oxidoreductase YrpB (nitropropane dioxygenase family)
MWNDTAAARRLGVQYPIVQGPFGGGFSSVKLAAEVSNAGGLGSYLIAMWAGQGAPLLRHRHAKSFFDALFSETAAAVRVDAPAAARRAKGPSHLATPLSRNPE